MSKLTFLYMQGCPYCVKAKKALEELQGENEAYKAIETEWIDEDRNPQLVANLYYYYVPTIYMGGRKLYEAHPSDDYDKIRRSVKAALDEAL